MQMVKKIFIALVLVWFGLLLFMPKQELYYKLEKELEKKSVKINEKSIDEGLFSLTINEADVYAKGIKLATIEKLSFFTLLFYTNVEVENLVLDESLKEMAPTKTDALSISHALWNPVHININAQGSFGGLGGNVALADKTMRLDFNDSKGIEMLKAKLKNDEKGWYHETSF
jgi:hypothetical protein